ncbi:hypothetical protein C2S52_011789 [Perilla frutescens var. hirtella]|nr:hypothetical protein C2S52_011789 [Perilla frutescens var. hirtella]
MLRAHGAGEVCPMPVRVEPLRARVRRASMGVLRHECSCAAAGRVRHGAFQLRLRLSIELVSWVFSWVFFSWCSHHLSSSVATYQLGNLSSTFSCGSSLAPNFQLLLGIFSLTPKLISLGCDLSSAISLVHYRWAGDVSASPDPQARGTSPPLTPRLTDQAVKPPISSAKWVIHDLTTSWSFNWELQLRACLLSTFWP